MKNYPRHRANTPKDIYKDTYEEIIVSAKRKHSSKYSFGDEFYIFKLESQGTICYCESSVDIYNSAFEHWKKINGRWQKI